MLMQSTNKETNALESIIGIFLHSCKAPQKVIDTLARMGISISMSAIHQAVTSLSAESAEALHRLGQTLLVVYAYDNFDVNLKASIPTAERTADTLKHSTSAVMLPLQHGVTHEDMRCSEELWKKSHLNPNANPSHIPAEKTWKDLLGLHPEVEHPSRLTQHDRFNSWKFLNDICRHGPAYFSQFRGELDQPKVIEQIPVVKTPTIPARAMEFSNSTVSGNISTIKNLAEQGGIGDPADHEVKYKATDLTQYVVLFHGDLGTGDRILSIQQCRSIEDSPWNRFQFVVFIPGLFHVKMACADAIWRIFIQPSDARVDDTCLMHDAAKLRPKETGVIASKPGFRHMHQVIGHSGICRRLDCWRTKVL
jgi:hypothetical protein